MRARSRAHVCTPVHMPVHARPFARPFSRARSRAHSRACLHACLRACLRLPFPCPLARMLARPASGFARVPLSRVSCSIRARPRPRSFPSDPALLSVPPLCSPHSRAFFALYPVLCLTFTPPSSLPLPCPLPDRFPAPSSGPFPPPAS